MDDDPELLFLPSSSVAGGLDFRHKFGADDDWEVSGYALASSVRGDSLAIGRLQRQPQRYYQRPDADHVAFDADATGAHRERGELSPGQDRRQALPRRRAGAVPLAGVRGERAGLPARGGQGGGGGVRTLVPVRAQGRHPPRRPGVEPVQRVDHRARAHLHRRPTSTAASPSTACGARTAASSGGLGGLSPRSLRGGPALQTPGSWGGWGGLLVGLAQAGVGGRGDQLGGGGPDGRLPLLAGPVRERALVQPPVRLAEPVHLARALGHAVRGDVERRGGGREPLRVRAAATRRWRRSRRG